jgi:hypothetical protein
MDRVGKSKYAFRVFENYIYNMPRIMYPSLRELLCWLRASPRLNPLRSRRRFLFRDSKKPR